jgi:hypothetical protein
VAHHGEIVRGIFRVFFDLLRGPLLVGRCAGCMMAGVDADSTEDPVVTKMTGQCDAIERRWGPAVWLVFSVAAD